MRPGKRLQGRVAHPRGASAPGACSPGLRTLSGTSRQVSQARKRTPSLARARTVAPCGVPGRIPSRYCWAGRVPRLKLLPCALRINRQTAAAWAALLQDSFPFLSFSTSPPPKLLKHRLSQNFKAFDAGPERAPTRSERIGSCFFSEGLSGADSS